MNDRWANIDLVFRNGLKDFEALPPEDVWDNVRPAISKKPSYIFLKAAAIALIMISVGLTAYIIGRKSVLTTDDIVAGYVPLELFNINQPAPVFARSATSKIEGAIIANNEVLPEKFNLSVSSENTRVSSEEQPSLLADNLSSGGNFASTRQEPVYSLPGNLDKIINGSNPDQDLDASDFQPGKVKSGERWSIAALVSPTYYSKTGSGNNDLVRDMIASEKSMPSVSGGFSVSYNISKRVSIQTGLYYSSHGQQVQGVNSYSGFAQYYSAKGSGSFTIMTSDGPVYSKNTDVFISGSDNRIQTLYTSNVFDPEKASLAPLDNSITQRFGYLQMPLTVRYKFLDRAIDLDLAGGISYDFLVGNSAFVKSGGDKYVLGETEGLNNFVFSSSLGVGMEYSISSKMSLNIEPTFRYFLNPFNDASGTWLHPYSFGVFTGFSYKF